MVNSISKRVKRYLTKHPEACNQELYKKFPKVRTNTLRHYKSRFVDQSGKSHHKNTLADKKRESAVQETLKSRVFKFLSTSPHLEKSDLYTAFPNESKKSLSALNTSFHKLHPSPSSTLTPQTREDSSKPETKIQALEARIEHLEVQVKSLLENPPQPHSKSSVIETLREMEESLLHYIKDKRGKGSNESSSLDELQQFVSTKFSSFITGLRIKKK